MSEPSKNTTVSVKILEKEYQVACPDDQVDADQYFEHRAGTGDLEKRLRIPDKEDQRADDTHDRCADAQMQQEGASFAHL